MCAFFSLQTGYRIQFLPLYTGSLALVPGSTAREALPEKDTEPIAVTTFNWPAGHHALGRFGSGEYIASWFVGQIAEDAVSGVFLSGSEGICPFDYQVPDVGTAMPNEASFVARLCTIEEALEKLKAREVQRHVLEIAWKAWQYTLDVDSGRVLLNSQGVPGSATQ